MPTETHVVNDIDFDAPNNQFNIGFTEGPTMSATFPKPPSTDLANRNVLNTLMDSLIGGIQICVQLNGSVIQRVSYGACQTHVAFCADLRLMGDAQAAAPPPSGGKGKSASPKAGKANGAARKRKSKK